ncbi:MAG TPA: acetyl-CoA carboxylase carboxyltransferase subunit alpha [Victivallales bacterium]|nr:acetyl-CoA carboxylase carboxyltransferase subunit alpha [Victivallales bacterium]
MVNVVLDFEKPVMELEAKVRELQNLSASNDIDVSDEIAVLEKKLEATKEKVYHNLSAWERVQLARHPNRPYTLDYVDEIFTDYLQLHGDRRYGEDAAIVGGFAKIDDQKIMVIGTQKGRNIKENVYRNFGCPHPEGYRKALRLMELADSSNVPIITFIDTPGAFPGIASEERHIGEAIAVNLREMFNISVPIISIVLGEGGSGGALGIGVGNKILVMEHAYYSVITPEGCAAILWKDRAFSAKAAKSLRLTSTELKELGIVDEVVPEPIGGAHNHFEEAAQLLKKSIKKNLQELGKLSSEKLKEQRYQKYRHIGKFIEE